MKKKKKGITLVALVITIIVLLILAGISISLALGNNGIITNAQKASVAWTQGEAETQLAMAFAACETDYQIARADDATAVRADYYSTANINKNMRGTGFELVTDIVEADSDNAGHKKFKAAMVTAEDAATDTKTELTINNSNGDGQARKVNVIIKEITVDTGLNSTSDPTLNTRLEHVVSVSFSKWTSTIAPDAP